MRILLTNDDGFDAPGMGALIRIAESLIAGQGGEIWLVAPERNQSGLAHSLSLHDPLRVRQLGERRFWVSGTPTDCVIMAVRELMPERPDLVLSGVNAGENSGDDVTYSGTVAGAIEGTLLGIPSIALSQKFDYWTRGFDVPFITAETCAPELIREILAAGVLPGQLININFPDRLPEEITGIKVTRQGSSTHGLFIEKREDSLLRPYYWLQFQKRDSDLSLDTDLSALSKGFISVTPLKLDLTDDAGLARFAHLSRAR